MTKWLLQVKDIVQKAADKEVEDTTYTEGELSEEVQALWDNYDPSKDSQCTDHQVIFPGRRLWQFCCTYDANFSNFADRNE